LKGSGNDDTDKKSPDGTKNDDNDNDSSSVTNVEINNRAGPIPVLLNQFITEDNKRFAFDLRAFEGNFFHFVSSLYTHLNDRMDKEKKKDSTAAQATTITSVIPKPKRLLLRSPSITEHDLSYVEWGVEFMTDVLSRASNNHKPLHELACALRSMLNRSTTACEWLLLHFCERRDDLRDLLLVCPDSTVRYEFSQLLNVALRKVSPPRLGVVIHPPVPTVEGKNEGNEGGKGKEGKEGKEGQEQVNTSERFMSVLRGMLHETAAYWHRFSHYFDVWLQFTATSRSRAVWCAQNGDIATLVDFYLGPNSPLLKDDVARKGRRTMGNPVQQPNFANLLGTLANIVSSVPNFNHIDVPSDSNATSLREERRQALIKIGMITDGAQSDAKATRLIPQDAVSLQSADIYENASAATLEAAVHAFSMTDIEKDLLLSEIFWTKTIDGRKNLEAFCQIIHHLSWGDQSISQQLVPYHMSRCDWHGNKNHPNDIHYLASHLQVLEAFVSIPDEYQEDRIRSVLGSTPREAIMSNLKQQRQEETVNANVTGGEENLSNQESHVGETSIVQNPAKHTSIVVVNSNNSNNQSNNVGNNQEEENEILDAQVVPELVSSQGNQDQHHPHSSDREAISKLSGKLPSPEGNNIVSYAHVVRAVEDQRAARSCGSCGGGPNPEDMEQQEQRQEAKQGPEQEELIRNVLLYRAHKNRLRFPKWSSNIARWIVRMACCSDKFHKVLASLPLHNEETDSVFSDYIFRLVQDPKLLQSDPVLSELEQYEQLRYPGRPTSAQRFDNYLTHTEIYAEDVSNGVAVCANMLVDDLDVQSPHKIVFTFKNTLDIPVQIRLTFNSDGIDEAPSHAVPKHPISHRLNALETYDMSTLYRYDDCDQWVVSHYTWQWEPASLPPSVVASSEAAATGSSVVQPAIGPQLPSLNNSNTASATIDNANIVPASDVVVVSNPIADAAADAARNRTRANSDDGISSSSSSSLSADPEKVQQLCGMGFSDSKATEALIAYNNNLESACNYLLGM
jgi:hypothetical protein